MLPLLKNRNFFLLWSGSSLSLTGDWLLRIGLSVYVYAQTESALITSIVLILGFLPGIFLGTIAGWVADRWDRRQILLFSNILLALGLLPLLLIRSKEDIWIVYCVQFLEACIAQFILPAENALIPQIVKQEQLISANAINSLGQNVARLLGSGLGGLLLSHYNLSSVILLDIASFICVAIFIFFVQSPARPAPPSEEQEIQVSFWRQWGTGLQSILQSHVLIILLIMIGLQSIGEGVFGVLLIVLIQKDLALGADIYGSLGSMQAIGSILSGVIFSLLGARYAPVRLLGFCACLFGLLDLAIINMPFYIPDLWLLWLLWLLVGIPGTGMMIGFNALLQNHVMDHLRGRVFGFFISIMTIMNLLGMILAGALGEILGARFMLNIQGSMYTLSGLLVLLTLTQRLPFSTVHAKNEKA